METPDLCPCDTLKRKSRRETKKRWGRRGTTAKHSSPHDSWIERQVSLFQNSLEKIDVAIAEIKVETAREGENVGVHTCCHLGSFTGKQASIKVKHRQDTSSMTSAQFACLMLPAGRLAKAALTSWM